MSQSSPSITFMLQYTEANSQYVDYTNRDEAVEIENELLLESHSQQVEDLTEEQIQKIKQNVPEQSLNFREYIDYMNRSYATEKQNQDMTAVFNGEANYLQKSRVEELKQDLELAYQNGSLLWQGVISFDNAFLAEQGLYDKETGQVDQQAIKNVIREAVPKLIEREGLSDSAFWWGNIHLNTDNIHVHIGLSEIESAREKIFYAPRGRMEYKGNFSQKTIQKLKSEVFHGLLQEETRSRIIRKEQILANLKTDLLKDVFRENLVTSAAEKNFLEQAYNHLPLNKKWRYGSNASDFAVSKFFLNKYLDSYFQHEGKENYQVFLNETKEFLETYKEAYSTGKNQTYEKVRYVNGQPVRQITQSQGYDLDHLLQKREQELRERLGNQILKKFREQVPQITAENQKSNLENFSTNNQKMIVEQLPSASLIYSKESWEKKGYQIPEGTKPLKILKPSYSAYDKHGRGIGTPEDFVLTEVYDISQVEEDILSKQLNLRQLSLFSTDELKELVALAKNKKNRTEKERQELGTYRYALKLSTLKEKQGELLLQRKVLSQVQPTAEDGPFVNFKKKELDERLEYTRLQLTPNYQLEKEEMAIKATLQKKYVNSIQFPVDQATAGNIQLPIRRLREEVRVLSSLRDENLLSLLKGEPISKQDYIEELETQVQIFQVKHAVYKNNQKLAVEGNPDVSQSLRRENAQYFSELKQLYKKLLPDEESEKQNQLTRVVSKQMEGRLLQRRSGLQQENGKFHASNSFMKGLSTALASSSRANMKAFMERVRSDERVEREEQSMNH